MSNFEWRGIDRRRYPRVTDAVSLRVTPLTSRNTENHSGAGEYTERAESQNTDQLSAAQELPATPSHVVRLSATGLRFVNTDPLQPGQSVSLDMHLGSENMPMQINGSVVCAGEEKNANKVIGYYAGIRFEALNDGLTQRLNRHIEYVLKQSCMPTSTLPHTRAAMSAVR